LSASFQKSSFSRLQNEKPFGTLTYLLLPVTFITKKQELSSFRRLFDSTTTSFLAGCIATCVQERTELREKLAAEIER
jgi:hypothetical protein